jgi:hypothetical protein
MPQRKTFEMSEQNFHAATLISVSDGITVSDKGDKAMTNNLKNTLFAGALALAAMIAPSMASAQSGTRTFTVYNNSSYTIDHVYVSATSDENWGQDRLGSDYFPPNYTFKLPVYPGWYDVKLVDEDGDSCVVHNVDFRSGTTWSIDNTVLLTCELITATR